MSKGPISTNVTIPITAPAIGPTAKGAFSDKKVGSSNPIASPASKPSK